MTGHRKGKEASAAEVISTNHAVGVKLDLPAAIPDHKALGTAKKRLGITRTGGTAWIGLKGPEN